jgi:hypothetical protein
MNAYLFTGWVSQYEKGRFGDRCLDVILYGADEATSWKTLEEMLLSRSGGEDPTTAKVEKMVGAPVLDQLFTETGYGPLNWPEIAEEIPLRHQSFHPPELGAGS